MIKVLVGDTFKQTFVNSGSVPSSIVAAVYDGEENIVSSGSGVSSGNGHFYRMTSVSTTGYYVSEWRATISGNPYKRRITFEATLGEAD